MAEVVVGQLPQGLDLVEDQRQALQVGVESAVDWVVMAGSVVVDDIPFTRGTIRKPSYRGKDHQKRGNGANNHLNRHASDHRHFKVATTMTHW